jgi:hypothetical protein
MKPNHPFIEECLTLFGENMALWPFPRHNMNLPWADPRILHAGVALAVKTLFEPADDGDTVWFWNVCREARARAQGAYFKADAVAAALGGLLIQDPLTTRRAAQECHEAGVSAEAFLSLCAGCPIGPFGQLSWLAFFLSEDDRVRWLMVRAYREQKRRYSVLDAATRWWENGVRRKYPNLMGDVLARYYGPDHVFTRWTQGRL